MIAVRHSNGEISIPVRVEGPNGLVGDAVERIGPDHPDFEKWAAEAEPEPDYEAMEEARLMRHEPSGDVW